MTPPRPNGSPAAAEQPAQRSRLTPGFVDELGDRSLSLDPATGTLIETLRLRSEFSEALNFESALRDRVARVLRLKHPAFATVQAVVRSDSGLEIVSAYASGRRLSELTPIDNGFALAVDVIRRITPALAALHNAGAGTGHGALSLNRLVMTRDKRLIVVEHVLAPALESMHWSRVRFNDLDLVVADTVPVRLDERTDLRQLGWIVLSLLVGRSLRASEHPGQTRALFDEARSLHTALKTTALGAWLERALQIAPDSFASADDATDAFDALAHDGALQVAESEGALLAFHSEASDAAAPVAATEPPALDSVDRFREPVKESRSPATVVSLDAAIDRAAKLHAVPPSPATPAAPAAPATVAVSSVDTNNANNKINVNNKIKTSGLIWIAGALGAVAIFQAIALAVLMMRPSIVIKAPQTAAPGPPALPPVVVQAAPARSSIVPARSPIPSAIPSPRPGAAVVTSAAPRLGGFTVTSPIELQVFTNGSLIGSTAGPVAIGEGRHTLEFVNQVLGFRVTQVVDVVGGRLTPVRVSIPSGHVSINAVPWAEVTIDGVAAGPTPLGNLSLPIGMHDIVFRHPDLGERRQTVVVRADIPTRVTETFK